MKPHRSCRAALFALILSSALGGCLNRNTGYRISNETVAFIHPGKTSWTDVVENLGPPLLELQNPHVAAYSWGRVRSTATARPLIQDQGMVAGQPGYAPPPPPTDLDDSGGTEGRRWLYCIGLDANNRVTRAGTFELQGAGSLENAVRQWAGQPSAPSN